jgi:hypothetical protein
MVQDFIYEPSLNICKCEDSNNKRHNTIRRDRARKFNHLLEDRKSRSDSWLYRQEKDTDSVDTKENGNDK